MSRTARIFSNITNVDYLQSVRSFKYKNLDLRRLAEQIKTDRFKFSTLQMAKVPKSNNRYRIICMPGDKDKFVQQILLKNLSSKEEDVCNVHSDISFGGPNKGVAKAIKMALTYMKKYPYYLKIDIVSFFDEIDRNLLIRKINKLKLVSPVKKLLIQVVNCELKFRSKEDKQIAEQEGIKRGKGVRQGMPLSPYLSDLALKDFDRKLCKLKRIKAIRYCDDMLIFGKSERVLKEIISKIENWLKDENLQIHTTGKKKPVIAKRNEKTEFLGYVLKKGKAYVSKESKNNIKINIRSYLDWRKLKNKNVDMNLYDFIKKLKAMKIGYINAYSEASNKKHLNELIDKNIKMVFCSVLTDILGEDSMNKIVTDKDKMRFLGVNGLIF